MPQISKEMIVLKKTKLAEMDLIVTGLAADGLQVRAVVKGGRKPGSRRGAHLELFSRSRLLLHQGRSSLLTVLEAELVDAHAGCRIDIEHSSAAAVLTELTELVSRDAEAEPRLYRLLDAALGALEATAIGGLELMVAAAALKVVSQVGFRPNLDGCLACGADRPSAEEAQGWRFSYGQGGLLCADCFGLSAGEDGFTVVDPALLGWLDIALRSRFVDLEAYASVEHQAVGRMLLSFCDEWMRSQVAPRNRSLDFFCCLG